VISFAALSFDKYLSTILLLSDTTISFLLLNNNSSAAALSNIAFSNIPTLSQDHVSLSLSFIFSSRVSILSIVILTVSSSDESNSSVVFFKSSHSQLDR
jgi:hypothetical protein